MEVSMGGTLKNRWFILENPNLKWMMTGGTPMTKRKPSNNHQHPRVSKKLFSFHEFREGNPRPKRAGKVQLKCPKKYPGLYNINIPKKILLGGSSHES